MSALLPSQVLDAAADLIEPEGAWTQRAWARGKTGRSVEPTGKAATCWCMAGAVRKVVGPQDSQLWIAGKWLRSANPGFKWFGPFNDTRTHSEVVAALRKAADLARSEGQ